MKAQVAIVEVQKGMSASPASCTEKQKLIPGGKGRNLGAGLALILT